MSQWSVVVVDDDIITQELICLAIEDHFDAQVFPFNSSRLARDFLLKQDDNAITLVISDQIMPGYDGLSLLELCRKRGWEIPFIMLTSDATRETVLKAKRLGATQFMAKPFRAENLINTVKKAMA